MQNTTGKPKKLKKRGKKKPQIDLSVLPSTEILRKRRHVHKKCKESVSYELFKEWITAMGFKSAQDYTKFYMKHKLPPGIPHSPREVYADVYECDAIIYGAHRVIYRQPIILPYPQAYQLVRDLNLTSQAQYKKYVQEYEKHKPYLRLPTSPPTVGSYKPYWTSWMDFLGTDNISYIKQGNEMYSYEKAKSYVHQLHLKNPLEWSEYTKSGKLPRFIPRQPQTKYSWEYEGISDWLGTNPESALKTRNLFPGVWAVMHKIDSPPNILDIKTFRGGQLQASIYANDNDYTIVRYYTYEHNLIENLDQIIIKNSTSYINGSIMTNNVNELLFELDMNLLVEKKIH